MSPQLLNQFLAETLEKCNSEFIESIISLCQISPYSNSKLRITSPRFEVLKPTNIEYNKLKYYEDQLDKRILDTLLIPFFNNIFEKMGIDCRWPQDDSTGINVGFSYTYPFEFIIVQNQEVVGYSFKDHFWPETLPLLLAEYEVDHIAVIEWKDDSNPHHAEIEYNNSIERLTLKQFFCYFFSESDYSYFIEHVKEAIRSANNIIGFQTIAQLTLSNLSELRRQSIEDFRHIDYYSLRYQVPTFANNKKIKKVIKTDDLDKLVNQFYCKELYLALLGNNEFARCFITSEYLFSLFENESRFDYTAVVLGYIKSVEQLLYHLMKLTLDMRPNGLWIKKNGTVTKNGRNKGFERDNPKTNKAQIRFLKEYENNFDISLTPLLHFLCDNSNAWIVDKDSVETIRATLFRYAQECRNEHFHKENITERDDVIAIRNNTILVLFYVLGGYVIPDLETKLGIIDLSFENLYRKLNAIPRSQFYYWITFDGETYINAIRLIDQPHPIYDSNGSLQNSKIEFVAIDSFDSFDFDEFYRTLPNKKKIVIDSKNMPKEIWLYKKFKKEMVKLEW